MNRRISINRIIDISVRATATIVQREMNYYGIKPTHAVLFMTYRCTSRCRMCTIWRRDREVVVKDELSFEEWKRVIDLLQEMGVSIIEFFGGDALLRKDILIPLIAYAKKRGFFTELPTNCNLLDRETAIGLANSGLDNIWISLDGVGSTHDEVRGRAGSFGRVDTAIKEILKARKGNKTPKMLFNCVISKINLDRFEEIIPYSQEMRIDGIDFEYVGEIPQSSIWKSAIDGVNPTPLFISPEASNLLDEKEALLLKNKLEIIRTNSVGNGLRANIQKIDFLTIKELISGEYPNRRCYICRNIIHIDPYGNVVGCIHFNNYYLGNIRKENLISIWRNDKHKHFISCQNKGQIQICKYCSNGLQRNYTPFQYLKSLYLEITKKAKN